MANQEQEQFSLFSKMNLAGWLHPHFALTCQKPFSVSL